MGAAGEGQGQLLEACGPVPGVPECWQGRPCWGHKSTPDGPLARRSSWGPPPRRQGLEGGREAWRSAALCPRPGPRAPPGWQGVEAVPRPGQQHCILASRRGNQGTAQRGARGHWSAAALPSPALVTACPPPWLVLARATDTLMAEPGSARRPLPWCGCLGLQVQWRRGLGPACLPDRAGAKGRRGRGCWPRPVAGHTGCWCPSHPECATVRPHCGLWGIMDSSAGDTWPCRRPDAGLSTAPTQAWFTAYILRTQF